MTTQFDACAAKLKKKIETRVAQIKQGLTAYIEQDTDLLIDGAPVSIALLEMALDRYIELHGEHDTRELIESSIRRAVQKARARLN